jgi:hypothetical protein
MTPLDNLTLLDMVPDESLPATMTALVAAFLLGLLVSWLHRFSVPHRMVPISLRASLAMLPVVSTMVLIVIGDSLARSFALVGALAIVRFRTRLRTTWDITFVFLSLAVGIGCGVGRLEVAIGGTLVALLATLAIGVLPGTRPQGNAKVVRCDVAAWQCGDAQLGPILARFTSHHSMTSTRSLRFGETLSLTYQIYLNDDTQLEELVRELAAVEGVARIVALAGEQEGEDGAG